MRDDRHLTAREEAGLVAAAQLFRDLGVSAVFIFGSAARGHLRPDSDVDMAVSGLPPRLYFSAVQRASDILGRPVDLVDLDDDSPRVRFIRDSGELIPVN